MLEAYEEMPIFILVGIKEDVVESVARKLSGSAGSGGMESEALQRWLLKFVDDSKFFLLVFNISWPGFPIISHPELPIGHLFLAAWLHWISNRLSARSEPGKPDTDFLLSVF